MSKRRLIAAVFTPVVLLAGCASSGYGGSISGSGDALSPEERRLQAAETKITTLSRRLDSVNLTGMDQENQRLRDDIRALRGEFERMRYDNDQQAKRNQALYVDLDRRLQRFEAPIGMNSSAVPQPASPAGTFAPAPSSAIAPAAAAPAVVAGGLVSAPGAAASQAPAAALPSVPAPTASGGIAAPVVISSGGGASVEEETAYLGAFDDLKNGKYDNAIKGFKSMLDKWPAGAYAANAHYWMGEAQYVKGDYKGALTSFQTVFQRFPTSAKAPDATLKSGEAQFKLKQDP